MSLPGISRSGERARTLSPVFALWVLPLWWLGDALLPPAVPRWSVALGAIFLAPLPAIWVLKRLLLKKEQTCHRLDEEREVADRLCQTMEYRAQRLGEDLIAANQQMRSAQQLALLGQFVAGFLHEVNNPLAILTNRVEVLLVERPQDAPLSRDLSEILKEARYIENIAGTLLPALRKAQSESSFEPASPAGVLCETMNSMRPLAQAQGVTLFWEAAEVPRVNLPAHIVDEIARALVSNAIQALEGRPGAAIWVLLRPYAPGRATVRLDVEDNGAGVPESLRPHLFEPFVSRGIQKQRSGLGLFIVASLLTLYDGSVRFEPRAEGGARFSVEMPRARFTRDEPYHWFPSEEPEAPEGPR